jgi:NAD(P)H-nitrite reductase large subunit
MLQLCVETLRQENRFTGRLLMVTAESTSPYDRPKLSKALSIGVEEIRLRKEDYYKV